MKTTGVIIARFQTPHLHEGHHKIIRHVRERHNKIVILLGVAPTKLSQKNPLDFYTRERMVKMAYADLTILPLPDMKYDEVWSANLDTLLQASFPSEKFVLYGSRNSFIPYYSGKFATEEIPEEGNHNSTDLREQISDRVKGSEDFRHGIIYAAYNQYAKVYPTVDIAVFRNNKTELLLAKRDREGKWRFPGGFVDPTDDNYEAAAKRELAEECGDIETGAMTYVKSFRVNDWRYKNSPDKIITTLFSCDLMFGAPKANDDIDYVKWFRKEEITQLLDKKLIAEEHIELINHVQFN